MGTLDLTLVLEIDPIAIYCYRDGMLAVDLLMVVFTGLDFFT